MNENADQNEETIEQTQEVNDHAEPELNSEPEKVELEPNENNKMEQTEILLENGDHSDETEMVSFTKI